MGSHSHEPTAARTGGHLELHTSTSPHPTDSHLRAPTAARTDGRPQPRSSTGPPALARWAPTRSRARAASTFARAARAAPCGQAAWHRAACRKMQPTRACPPSRAPSRSSSRAARLLCADQCPQPPHAACGTSPSSSAGRSSSRQIPADAATYLAIPLLVAMAASPPESVSVFSRLVTVLSQSHAQIT
jgi:hypothetical protein